MANNFDTSFIPQQPLLKVEGVKRRNEPVNFALVLALVIFVVALVVAGGTYFYKASIDREVLEKAQALEEAEKSLAINDIELYKRVDTRLSAAKSLLAGHNVFLIILDLLEESAAQNIGLTSLSYAKGEKGEYVLSLAGQATSYGGVYFQSQTWRDMAPLVKQVEISGITLEEETGIVTFTARLSINADLTRYARILEAKRKVEEAAVAKELLLAPPDEEINPTTP